MCVCVWICLLFLHVLVIPVGNSLYPLGMGGRVGGWDCLLRDGGGLGRGWVGKDLMYEECVLIHNTTYTTYLLSGSMISRSNDYHLWALSKLISLILITKLLWQS